MAHSRVRLNPENLVENLIENTTQQQSKNNGWSSTMANITAPTLRSTFWILVVGLLVVVQLRLQARTGQSILPLFLLDASQQPLEENVADGASKSHTVVKDSFAGLQQPLLGVDNSSSAGSLRSFEENSVSFGTSKAKLEQPLVDKPKIDDDTVKPAEGKPALTGTKKETESATSSPILPNESFGNIDKVQQHTKSEDSGPTIKPRKPLNVIVLYPDDWRHDDIGGVAPVLRTPFLNQLAGEGIRFTHNAVTTSICWISRATLFTGQYASRHKSLRIKQPVFYKDWETTSWPALLQRQAGFFVGHVGKWQFANRGDVVSKSMFNWTSLFEGHHWYKGRPAANYTRDETIRFLRERPKGQPFAATVAFYPPKAVTLNPVPGAQWKPSKNIYENDTIPDMPYNVSESHSRLPWFFQTDERFGKHRFSVRWQSDQQYQVGMQHYYSLITEVDQACREIVEELKRQDVLNDTLVIFTTDNGLFHGAHGLAGKWYPYQESIRVPLIVKDPRMPPSSIGTLNDALTLNVDLAPTILGAAGIPTPSHMQGRDISDLYLTEQSSSTQIQPWRNEFYYEFPLNNGKAMPMSSAVVRHDLKYIFWPQYNYSELFNLTEDPLEQHDVSNDTHYASIILELQEHHDSLQRSASLA